MSPTTPALLPSSSVPHISWLAISAARSDPRLVILLFPLLAMPVRALIVPAHASKPALTCHPHRHAHVRGPPISQHAFGPTLSAPTESYSIHDLAALDRHIGDGMASDHTRR